MAEHISAQVGDHLRTQLVAWAAELLEEPQANVTDNFFDLGGHSVLALTFLGRVEERYGVELDIGVLFEQNLGQVAESVALRSSK